MKESDGEIRVRRSIDVDRSADDAFSYITDPANITQWSALVDQVSLDEKTFERGQQAKEGLRHQARKGSKARGSLRIVGLKFGTEAEVSDLDYEGRRAVIRTKASRGVKIESRLDVKEQDDGCIVHFSERVTIPGRLAKVGLCRKVTEGTVSAALRHTLGNIKTVLETDQEDGLRKVEHELQGERNVESV